MAEFFRLRSQIKRYEWGSANFIQRLLGLPIDGRPCAELWMGSHPGAPSLAELPGGAAALGDFIAEDPRRRLGEKTAERFGALPYLFKLLAAESPLSIQAHPSLALAREGFARENAAGLAPDAPERNYRDPNHKPEIICALTPFAGMCGFRSPAETARLISVFLGENPPAVLREGFAPLLQALEAPAAGADSGAAASAALRGFLAALFGVSQTMREALSGFALSREPSEQRHDGSAGRAGRERGPSLPPEPAPEDACEWELIRSFARRHPGDPAVIAPLYLNVFRLQPGEAVFLKAGVLHAYISGFGVELMANSDNVLRGGLTSKRVDVPELMKALDFSPMKPQILRPEPGASRFAYPVSCEEFSLAVMHGTGGATGGAAELRADGPSICIVTEGSASIDGETLQKGEAIFVPPAGAGEKPLSLRGSYTIYAASVGEPAPQP